MRVGWIVLMKGDGITSLFPELNQLHDNGASKFHLT